MGRRRGAAGAAGRRTRRLATLLALGGAAVAAAGPPPGPSGRWEVLLERRGLTVRADGAPLGQVLRDLARVTGLQVQCEGACLDPVSAFVTGLTPEETLRALLASTTHVLLFDGADAAGPATLRVIVPAAGSPRGSERAGHEGPGDGLVPQTALGPPEPGPSEGDDAFAEERRAREEEALLATLGNDPEPEQPPDASAPDPSVGPDAPDGSGGLGAPDPAALLPGEEPDPAP